MIECYYKWCPRHAKDEPFCADPIEKPCGRIACAATPTESMTYGKLRKLEELAWTFTGWDGAPEKNGKVLAEWQSKVSRRAGDAILKILKEGHSDG
jgi:hypothetical protein